MHYDDPDLERFCTLALERYDGHRSGVHPQHSSDDPPTRALHALTTDWDNTNTATMRLQSLITDPRPVIRYTAASYLLVRGHTNDALPVLLELLSEATFVLNQGGR